jgi:lysophospholipase L1-like esterase
MSLRLFVAMGDSFSAGTEPDVVPWPERVAPSLLGCRLVNLAEPGARSADVAANQLEPAIALGPDLVSLICGANDVLLTTRPDVGAFAGTFSDLLGRLREELPWAAFVTATYPDVAQLMPLRPRSRARVERGLRDLNRTIRWLSRRHGAVCLDFAGHPGRGERANFAGDGFHPSDAGHQKAAQAFSLALRDHFGIDPELREAQA